ncbi:hypothetical protein DPEC_G00278710 [Dallia pectoralis]|uniref:Uncharacterized protein n=1 Tax=Dallia pectoralis TaxID=75939 RepID=A0ACC2FLY0_DALPE|nr:hypothetical protein DPEC_G00278710 [Dallia pectoralis]
MSLRKKELRRRRTAEADDCVAARQTQTVVSESGEKRLPQQRDPTGGEVSDPRLLVMCSCNGPVSARLVSKRMDCVRLTYIESCSSAVLSVGPGGECCLHSGGGETR